jgi:tRNA-dihydrouridine synthase B
MTPEKYSVHTDALGGNASASLPAGFVLRPVQIGNLLIDPPIFQAPMAGFMDYTYREIAREFGGVGLFVTEMVSAAGFLHQVQGLKESIERLWRVQDEPRPLAVQMWDNDPATLADACRKLLDEYRVSIVDLNFGCPVAKVTEHAESGSYLLRNPARVGAIVERVVQACAPVPVTAKIRLGWTRREVTGKEVARAVEEAGGAALTVHGRVAEQFYSGKADWNAIAELKTVLKRIPLIGNGDIASPASAVAAFAGYGVDGVMIGRGALGRPWLYRQIAQALRGEAVMPDPDMVEQTALLRRHQRAIVERYGEDYGNMLMRKVSCCYAQGGRGVRAFRERASRCRTNAEFDEIMTAHFPAGGPSHHAGVL